MTAYPTAPLGFGGGGSSTVSRVILTREAAVNLSGDRVVAPRADGTVEYASSDAPGDASRPLWLTLGAALLGDDVQCLAFGEATEGTWAWIAGQPVFLGLNGQLTQTPPQTPVDSFIQQVAATTDSPTTLFFDPRVSIVL